jgi:hypothetical protein
MGLIDPQPQLLELPISAEGGRDNSKRVNALQCGTDGERSPAPISVVFVPWNSVNFAFKEQ